MICPVVDFPTIKARHVRVECSFLEVSRVREGELILALNSMNRLAKIKVKLVCFGFLLKPGWSTINCGVAG